MIFKLVFIREVDGNGIEPGAGLIVWSAGGEASGGVPVSNSTREGLRRGRDWNFSGDKEKPGAARDR